MANKLESSFGTNIPFYLDFLEDAIERCHKAALSEAQMNDRTLPALTKTTKDLLTNKYKATVAGIYIQAISELNDPLTITKVLRVLVLDHPLHDDDHVQNLLNISGFDGISDELLERIETRALGMVSEIANKLLNKRI